IEHMFPPGGGGVIPVLISQSWQAIICFANVKNNHNKKRGLFSLAGKICKIQRCKIAPLIFAKKSEQVNCPQRITEKLKTQNEENGG
ncbi:MAG: hypothetical protein QME46_05420, partial [Thermoanaerobacteraceae bacterium]|nr:hypothetical protein [Thermoanaerobacteraceae bacterium]